VAFGAVGGGGEEPTACNANMAATTGARGIIIPLMVRFDKWLVSW
jgi:hypothetical protein